MEGGCWDPRLDLLAKQLKPKVHVNCTVMALNATGDGALISGVVNAIHHPLSKTWHSVTTSQFTSLFTSIQVHLSFCFTPVFLSWWKNIALRSHLPAAARMVNGNTVPTAFVGFNSNSHFCNLFSHLSTFLCTVQTPSKDIQTQESGPYGISIE
jgi:hypothetical protein